MNINKRAICVDWFDDSTNFQVGNHDNSRMATRYGPALVDGINMIVLLLPGVGVTYMVNLTISHDTTFFKEN